MQRIQVINMQWTFLCTLIPMKRLKLIQSLSPQTLKKDGVEIVGSPKCKFTIASKGSGRRTAKGEMEVGVYEGTSA